MRIPLSSFTTNGRGPTAPNAKRASPEACARQHRLMVARSTPRRRVTRPKAAPTRVDGIGRSIDSTISAPLSIVCPGPVKNSDQRHAPRSPAPVMLTIASIREQRGSCVRGRRRVADVAGQRGAIADLHRTHHAGGLDQRRKMAPHPLVADQVGHDRERADAQARADLDNAGAESRDLLDVDHDLRPGASDAQLRHQVGSPRQQPRVRPISAKQSENFVERLRSSVCERSQT